MSCATQVIVNCWTKPHILHSLIWHLIKVLLNWIWSSYQGVATGAVRGTKAFLLKTPFFNFSAFQHSLDMWGCWVQLQLKIKIMMCICSGKVTTLGHLQPFAKEETNISSRDRDQMGGFPSKANSNITRHLSLLFLVSHALSTPFDILAFASIFTVEDFWTKHSTQDISGSGHQDIAAFLFRVLTHCLLIVILATHISIERVNMSQAQHSLWTE